MAAGVFLKRMHEPIEQVIQGGAPPILVPRNSDSAVNRGMELEMRLGLGRITRMLDRFAVNANASFIHSEVTLKKQLSKLGSERHPLAGQADVLSNVALSARLLGGRADATVLVGHVGKRLRTLGLFPSPDVYQQPVTTLDATLNWNPSTRLRVKLAGKNLLDPRIQDLQLGKEVSGFRRGRTVTLVFTYGG